MRIGYPCLNSTIGCTAASKFRLASYSDERLASAVENNLACTMRILRFNVAHNILAFRLTSDLVPFASHPICTYPWQGRFADAFGELGALARAERLRISMHPGQYTLINSPRQDVFEASLRELVYHADVLDLMGLDLTARLQMHVGGVYGDREASMERFVQRLALLPEHVRARLAIENDDVSYPLHDCLHLAGETALPVVFDAFHHEVLGAGEETGEALAAAAATWSAAQGLPLVDYSSQAPGERAGRHITHVDAADLGRFLVQTLATDYDLMLEIKDKESSALEAVRVAWDDPRLERRMPEAPVSPGGLAG